MNRRQILVATAATPLLAFPEIAATRTPWERVQRHLDGLDAAMSEITLEAGQSGWA